MLKVLDFEHEKVSEEFCKLFNKEKTRTVNLINRRKVPTEDKLLLKAISFLRSNDLIAKPADKNLGMTVMHIDWYTDQVFKHLNDDKTYLRLDTEPDWVSIQSELTSVIRSSTYKVKEHLSKTDFQPSQFYVMPKLHKTPVKTRPIVPGYCQITAKVSEYLAKTLQPVVDQYPWVLKSQTDFIKHIENTTFTRDMSLASFDVESLYTSIDIKKALRCIKGLLLSHFELPKVDFIINLLQWVLTNNYFQFQGNWYKQISGTAMGTSCAPQFANLYLIHFERLKFKKDSLSGKHWKTGIYYRYLDDIIVTDSTIGLQDKFNDINSWTKDLRFTLDLGIQSINFLDLTVYKGERYHNSRILDLKPFVKAINPHLYTDPNSNVPDHYKYNWIKGEQIRLMRNSSSFQDYLIAEHKFRNSLTRRNYPKSIQDQYLCLEYSTVYRRFLLNPSIKKVGKQHRIFLNHDLYFKDYKYCINNIVRKLNAKFKLKLDFQVIFCRRKSISDYCNGNNKRVLLRDSSQDGLDLLLDAFTPSPVDSNLEQTSQTELSVEPTPRVARTNSVSPPPLSKRIRLYNSGG